jgi:hypothetical protein
VECARGEWSWVNAEVVAPAALLGFDAVAVAIERGCDVDAEAGFEEGELV